MNDFFLSVSDHLFRLDKDDNVFSVHEELPDAFIISVVDTFSAHHTRTHHKAPFKMSRFLRINCFEKIDGLFIALTLYTHSMWWCTIIDSAAPGKTLLRLAELSIIVQKGSADC